MSSGSLQNSDHRPLILRTPDHDDLLHEIRTRPGVEVIDQDQSIRSQLEELQPRPTAEESAEDSVWVYYPWRRTLIRLPGPTLFRRLRSDRNRNKITAPEQRRLLFLKVGVVGLSVGHAIAHTLALEGLCGELRLADFDSIELSNLNRIPATVFDLGVNKAVVAARRIAELDPYLVVETFPAGLTVSTMDAFFDGLDLVIEECDSLDMKVLIRQEAKRRRIPVLMETSDRGLFDVERFDEEPDRALFHGLLGDVDPESLRDLATRDKAPHVMRILQASKLSARMAASMVEIDRTVSTWPQLGGEVALGAATVAAAVRRFGRGQPLPSGRIRVDLETDLDRLGNGPIDLESSSMYPSVATDLTEEVPNNPLEAMIHSIRLAPSGGNIQPWALTETADGIEIRLVRERTSAMDVHFRGSYVAIGAATFNARVAAARYGKNAVIDQFPDRGTDDVAVAMSVENGGDENLAGQYAGMIRRISNRAVGVRAPLSADVSERLSAAAMAEGGELHLVTDRNRLDQLADVLADSDRLRYLTPLLHRQMISEIRWPGRDRLDLGIDVRTLALDEMDLAKLRVASRPEVMAALAAWDGGSALGDNTRDRVKASSALAIVTVSGQESRDYLVGGAAMQRVWICAEQNELGVQPVSPVFLYARSAADLRELSEPFAAELASLRDRFADIIGLTERQAPILVLRLSHGVGTAVRSERLSLADVMLSEQPLSVNSGSTPASVR